MKATRRVLSILMSIVLVVGLCPGLAYAAGGKGDGGLVAGVAATLSGQSGEGAGFPLKAAGDDVFQRKALNDDCEITSISAGSRMSAAVRSDGTLWTWGASGNEYISLGLAAGYRQVARPNMVQSGSVQSVVCGTDDYSYNQNKQTAALKDDGSLWVWGSNGNSFLGSGSSSSTSKPTKILDDVVSYDVSSSHYAAVTSDGSLYMWGKNDFGQLGTGTTESVSAPTKIPLDNVVAVSLGDSHSAALKADGSLWLWGDNDSGQIGNGSSGGNNYVTTPERVLDNVRSVSLGYSHSMAAKADGTLWTWGNNERGQLGDGTTGSNVSVPTQVPDFGGVSIIDAGDSYSAAIKADGTLWTWGRNDSGQLGTGSTSGESSPRRVLDGVNSVALGASHALAVKQDGTLWAWGSNNYCQLGDGSSIDCKKPEQIRGCGQNPGLGNETGGCSCTP